MEVMIDTAAEGRRGGEGRGEERRSGVEWRVSTRVVGLVGEVEEG